MFKWFPTFRKAGKFFRDNVTRPGRSLLFLAFFCALGLIYLESPLLYLFTSIVSVFILASIVSFVFRPNISLRAIFPDLVQAGKEISADFYLTNERNRSAFEVFVDLETDSQTTESEEEKTRLIHAIKPGKTVRESLQLRFLRRGVYPLPKVIVGSTFPFNLFRFRQSKTVNQKVIVTPAFHPLLDFQLPGSQQVNENENQKKRQFATVAGASEYIGNVEYREGMPVRRWDYSSWARTGKPIVREYREQQRGTATIFIDSFFMQANEKTIDQRSTDCFEAMLSLATSIADALSKKMISVSRLIIGPTIYPLIESSIDEQLRTIARRLALADISPNEDSELLRDDLFCEQAVGFDSYGFLLFNRLDSNREYFWKQFEYGGNACTTRLVTSEPDQRSDLGITTSAIAAGKVSLK